MFPLKDRERSFVEEDVGYPGSVSIGYWGGGENRSENRSDFSDVLSGLSLI